MHTPFQLFLVSARRLPCLADIDSCNRSAHLDTWPGDHSRVVLRNIHRVLKDKFKVITRCDISAVQGKTEHVIDLLFLFKHSLGRRPLTALLAIEPPPNGQYIRGLLSNSYVQFTGLSVSSSSDSFDDQRRRLKKRNTFFFD